MKKLRLGVLGASRHYGLRVATPLRDSLLIEPYGIASRNSEKARDYAEKWDFPVSYGSYEALFGDPDIDFVFITLPNHLHLEYIKKAADAGKPVICEKPLGLNAAEAAEAAAYCEKRAVPLMEAFMYPFHPQWRRAFEIVKSGELGRVMTVSGTYSYTNKDPGNIRNVAAFGGGGMLDIGCYLVSASRRLMEAEPLRSCCSMVRDAEFGVDSHASAILDFGGGRTAVFSVSTQLFPRQEVTAHGTAGVLSVELPFNMYADAPGRVHVRTNIGGRCVETEIADQYLLEFDAFAEALLEGAPVPIPVSDAVDNLAAIDALFRSAESGGWEPVARPRGQA
ncbi:Gfo/Idh/MocA family protein [Breznakiella homolactica]|uniref:Gfo/Idh/MocA family oxidoreductase n=1 Tax=Breznakiella homolactica TaxID=2798577 RepID=A0A7T7XQP8_9SPIR|nr:Gfo/Idh/MocA family oxidoreductase [Breznakiella homolactica]QQO10672.1 Gfo/Idh/MocA family oxidoreductase [Breznakiella homolactica]